ncbi:hypothetical protein NDU88_001180 [Pleurodeles waltl]|uniref:Uncharacterized protein n=1 Tax=Pleurodeles waltl TaxID=8319 RepID=A0AAV7R8A5_PLEWA|nr:hypothetical protein NDU88_001180 [Pleurodeles waltl]
MHRRRESRGLMQPPNIATARILFPPLMLKPSGHVTPPLLTQLRPRHFHDAAPQRHAPSLVGGAWRSGEEEFYVEHFDWLYLGYVGLGRGGTPHISKYWYENKGIRGNEDYR